MNKKTTTPSSEQQGLFEDNVVSVDNPVVSKSTGIRKRASLLPSYHANRDFFVADLLDIALKSDRASLEVPILALQHVQTNRFLSGAVRMEIVCYVLYRAYWVEQLKWTKMF